MPQVEWISIPNRTEAKRISSISLGRKLTLRIMIYIHIYWTIDLHYSRRTLEKQEMQIYSDHLAGKIVCRS